MSSHKFTSWAEVSDFLNQRKKDVFDLNVKMQLWPLLSHSAKSRLLPHLKSLWLKETYNSNSEANWMREILTVLSGCKLQDFVVDLIMSRKSLFTIKTILELEEICCKNGVELTKEVYRILHNKDRKVDTFDEFAWGTLIGLGMEIPSLSAAAKAELPSKRFTN